MSREDLSEQPIEAKWSLVPLVEKFSRDEDQRWKLINTYSKPFVVWSASHAGVCDGYNVRFLTKQRVLAPGETLEILTRHRTSSIILSCTEYETLEEAHAAYQYHLQNPDKVHGEYKWDLQGHRPVFPFQWSRLSLDHQAYYKAYQALPDSHPIYPIEETPSHRRSHTSRQRFNFSTEKMDERP